MMRSLTISSSQLSAEILTTGATLTVLRMEPDGPNMVLGFANPDHHLNIPAYAGAIVGPVANRIKDGQITIDGTTHQMPRNENGRTALHSGDEGLHAAQWHVAEHSADTLRLTTTCMDGQGGLPGDRQIEVMYHIKGADLHLDIKAKTSRTTAINIAHHPYWNLDCSADISTHSLQIEAPSFLPVDAANLPNGEIRRVLGTPFDFTKSAEVPLTDTLDVNFCLRDQRLATPRRCAVLTAANGRELQIETDAPGLQVYGGAFLPTMPAVLHGGGDLGPYGGIALEPQYWPNAPYHADFPSIILRPGDTWQQKTRYRFSGPRKLP